MLNNPILGLKYNPDVLDCLANLSNDEVFTPPDLVNQMLDMLPQELFKDPNTTFLDPATKTGVFLREIAIRLNEGLREEIPDRQERIDHIFQKQIFGIAITELTSLMARRSLYCSKYPNSRYSVSEFDNVEGNIRFRKIQHRWNNGRCAYCGASQIGYDRDEGLETHAYEFIHTTRSEEIFNMKFDVIIGNPPYQMSDGGGMGTSAIPMYQKFVEQALKLKPRYLSMIIPSRWFTGGRGLDDFRKMMLSDDRIRVLHDYLDASTCFPGVEIKGGICFFLWDRENHGDCEIFTHSNNSVSNSTRKLLLENMDTFVRYNELLTILEKVHSNEFNSFAEIVSPNDPFGFDVREENSFRRIKPTFQMTPFPNSINFYYNGWRNKGLGHIGRDSIRKNQGLLEKFQVLIPKAWGTGDPKTDWIKPFIVPPNSCCTETYLVIGPFEDQKTAENAISYTQTKFFHTLVSIVKITQNTMQKAYTHVPIQDFTKTWSDEELYAKYGLTEDEIEFIETMIRPIDLSAGDADE